VRHLVRRWSPLFAALAWAAPSLGAEAALGERMVVVGGDRDYPPYEFIDRDGDPAGYNVDLTRAIAEVMGLRVEIRLGGWSEMRAALRDGRIDMLQGVSYSDERARELDLSPPHTIVSHAIFVRKGTRSVSSLDELRGHEVALHRAGIMDETLTGMGYGATLLRTDTPADAMRLLAAGTGEYAVVAVLPGTYITRELKLTNVVPVAKNVASHRYGYAVRKGNTVLLSRITEGLAILKKTGRYDAIHEKWLGVLEPQGVSWGTFFKYGAVVFVPLLLVLGSTVLWSRSLKREVAQRTASLAREVVERKRAMEELRLNQAQLIQADKMAALGVLVSGVAHEINNPNGYILLNMPFLKDVYLDSAEMLEQRYLEHGDFMLGGLRYSAMREELPGMLDEMLEGARRIKRIVEDLKDFARQEDAPRLEPLDLNAVARTALRLVDNSIRKATHRVEVAYAEDLPKVRGNAQRIEQVIVNLVLNACQALPDSGRGIRVSTQHEPGKSAVLLAVEDDGVGIPAENLSRLTDPFFTTKRESGGTGLGLSVSAGIVKEHGGSLQFSSRPGAGTTVVLSLPAIHEEADR
jgi:polar amino acid transport system substrate-binding protein